MRGMEGYSGVTIGATLLACIAASLTILAAGEQDRSAIRKLRSRHIKVYFVALATALALAPTLTVIVDMGMAEDKETEEH